MRAPTCLTGHAPFAAAFVAVETIMAGLLFAAARARADEESAFAGHGPNGREIT